MDKLSGLILDVADDTDGAVLRTIYPQASSMPDFVKSAEYYPKERRDALPDDLFALVLHDGPVTLRKFACVDKAHTELSIQYFLKTAYKLPEEAVKVAAQNFETAAGWYKLEVPEPIHKLALGLMNAVTLGLTAPAALKTTQAGVQNNLAVAKQSGGMVNPNVLAGNAGAPVVR